MSRGKPSGPFYIDPSINERVAYFVGIQTELTAIAMSIEFRMRSHLLQHRDLGDAKIVRYRSDTGKDWWVELNDEAGQSAAMSIEYGHYMKNGKFVKGLGIVGGML